MAILKEYEKLENKLTNAICEMTGLTVEELENVNFRDFKKQIGIKCSPLKIYFPWEIWDVDPDEPFYKGVSEKEIEKREKIVNEYMKKTDMDVKYAKMHDS